MLLSAPYPYQALETFVVDGLNIHYLWVLPLTEAEVRFRHGHGLEALEQRLEEAGAEYLRLDRASVV